MKWKYNLTVLLALLMMGTGMLSTIGDAGVYAYPESSRAPLTPHAPIHIYNNFSTKAFQEGWSGTGVTGDPYVIEGLEIDASGHSWGIFIGQTDEHFVIRNCVIKIADTTSSPQYRGDNIYLTSVSNGTLVGNDILDSEFTPVMIRYCNNISVLDNNISGSNRSNGIYSWRSKDILIKDNRIVMNANIGISVSSSEDLIIANNSINDNRIGAIYLSNSMGCIILDNDLDANDRHAVRISGSSRANEFYSNTLRGGGIYFYLDEGGIGSQTISENNTVDGAPIYYYANKDLTSMSVPTNAGQVILGNVSGLTISDITFDKGSIGLQARYCDQLTIEDCTFTGLLTGMVIQETSFSDITRNVISDMESTGIGLEECNNITFLGNRVSKVTAGFLQSGICSGNEVIRNTFEECNEGISLYAGMFDLIGGNNNSFTHNTIINGTYRGIYAIYEQMSIIANNTILNTGMNMSYGSAIELFNTKNLTVSGNYLLNSSNGIDVNGIYWGSSWHNTIENNRIEGSRGMGVRINQSMGGHYVENLIFSSMDFGIWVENSHSNEIHWNALINNNGSGADYSPSHIQARDDSTLNNWDRWGKGNYWSDWLTPDNDGDGIVDEHYLIFGDENFDTRPMTGSPIVYLSEPQDLIAVPADGEVILTWSEPAINYDDTIMYYHIFRKAGDGPDFETFKVNGTDTTMTDISAENNIEYHYWIAGESRYGLGRSSQEVMVTPDGTPPQLEILEPLGGTVTNKTALTFRWNGSDDVSFDHFEIKLDESDWIPQSGNTSANISHISEGEHTFFLAGVDTVGNRNEINISFIVDLTLPAAWFTMFPEGVVLSINATSLEMGWNGSDDIGVERYEIGVDDGPFIDANLIYSYVLTDLTEGEHVVRIKVWDQAGNWNITSRGFEVDLTKPIVHIVHPVNGWNTIEKNITAVWFTIENSHLPYSHQISVDGAEWIELGPGTEFNIMNLSVGVHSIHIRVTDSAGNIGENFSSFEVFENEIPPIIVTISGRVIDEDGRPLEGVKITSDDGFETITDSSGNFILPVEKGPRILTFEKKGYEDWTESIDANDNMTLADGGIVLQEEEKEEPFWRLRSTCYICCGIPMVILAIIILIWIIAKVSKKGEKELYQQDEE